MTCAQLGFKIRYNDFLKLLKVLFILKILRDFKSFSYMCVEEQMQRYFLSFSFL